MVCRRCGIVGADLMRQTQTLRQKMLAYACAAIGRLCRRKRKLLVVVGAGASIDFGMPSVNGVADILSAAAQDRYPLLADSSTSLYKYFENTVLADWQAKVPPHLQRTPTSEEILYVVFALAATFPAGRFTSALGAFVTVNSLPNINWYGRRRMAVDQNVLREFGHFLVDTLLNNFAIAAARSTPEGPPSSQSCADCLPCSAKNSISPS
jgi:hypothetical protein